MQAVSIVIPAFNAEDYIAKAIESVRQQTFSSWELIVINDGSTDRTAAVAELFCEIDDRVRVVSQSNGKLARARNRGIAAANSEFIAFLDADDIWATEKLQKQLDTAQRTKSDVIFNDAFNLSDSGKSKEVRLFGGLSGLFSGAEMFRILYAGNRIPVSSVLIRRSAQLQSECIFDEDPAISGVEDYELWLRLAAKGASFFGISEKLTGYRRHEGQMSRQVTSMMKNTMAVRKKYRATASGAGIDVRKQERIDERDLAYCSCNEGEIQQTWRSVSTLLDVKRFGITGLGAAIGATAHAIYHLFQRPSRTRG
jgi:teichuronic acid biosynthesis glycosyltransferase TuaG